VTNLQISESVSQSVSQSVNLSARQSVTIVLHVSELQSLAIFTLAYGSEA